MLYTLHSDGNWIQYLKIILSASLIPETQPLILH